MSHTNTPGKITLEFHHECCTDDFAHIAIAELVDKWRQIEDNETLVDGRFDKACEEFEAECKATKDYIQNAVNSFEAMREALEALVKKNEAINYAFYATNSKIALKEAMAGQKALLDQARQALTLAGKE